MGSLIVLVERCATCALTAQELRPIGEPGSHSAFALFIAWAMRPLGKDMAVDTSTITEHMDVIAADDAERS